MNQVAVLVCIFAITAVHGMDNILETGYSAYKCARHSRFEPLDILEVAVDAGSLHANEKVKSLCDCVMKRMKYAKPDNTFDVAAIKSMIPDKYNKAKVEAEIDECVKTSENNSCRFMLCVGKNSYTDMLLM